MANKGKY